MPRPRYSNHINCEFKFFLHTRTIPDLQLFISLIFSCSSKMSLWCTNSSEVNFAWYHCLFFFVDLLKLQGGSGGDACPRMNEDGKDIRRLSSTNPLFEEGQWKQIHEDHVYLSFEYGNSTTSLYNPFQCSVTHSEKPFLKQSFLNFNLSWFPLVLSLGTTEKNLVQSSLFPSIRYLYRWDPPWATFPLCLTVQFSQLLLLWQMLQFLNDLCGPSLDFPQYVPLSLVLGSLELDTAFQLRPLQCWAETKESPPSACWKHSNAV